MLVKVGKYWLPLSTIREIADEGEVFVAPKKWAPHAMIVLISTEIIRIEGKTAEQVARDINRQIVEAQRGG